MTPSSSPIVGTVRASAWAGLFDCPLRFYYTNIMGLRNPSSGAAKLGTAIHAGTAAFDTARLEGREASIDEAVDTTRAALQNPRDDVEWDDDLTPREADSMGILLTSKYCSTFAPQREYTAVELPCEALDIQTEHGVLRVTGTTDRIRIMSDGRKGISDLKSGKRATEKTPEGWRAAVTKGHALQIGIYTLMAEQASGERLEAPAEIIGLQTTKEAPIASGDVLDCKKALLGTDDMPGMITLAARMLKDGIFPPNPKSMMCSSKYCAGHGRCPYKA